MYYFINNNTHANYTPLNEVYICGRIIKKFMKEEMTTAVVLCRDEHNHTNFQYVAFKGILKEAVDRMQRNALICVKARAWIFRDSETKEIKLENLRLRGEEIYCISDVLSDISSYPYFSSFGDSGVLKEDVTFRFRGKISGSYQSANNVLTVLLKVNNNDSRGYNIIPLCVDVEPSAMAEALEKYTRGTVLDVDGRVAQNNEWVETDGRFQVKTDNHYRITNCSVIEEAVPEHSEIEIQIFKAS